MIAEVFDWIERHLQPTKQESADGREWMARGYELVERPVPCPLTMTGLKSFVRFAKLQEPRAELVVIVSSMETVELFGTLDDLHRKREYYGKAVAGVSDTFPAGQWLEQDEASRLIQQFFEPSDDRAKLLALIGTLTTGTSRTLADDGVTQQATTRRGVKADHTDVPNPVLLASYETFAEIQNPERAYVVRLRQAEGQTPLISLTPIPDPNVEQAIMSLVRDYLEADLPTLTVL